MRITATLTIFYCLLISMAIQAKDMDGEPDVISYHATIEPNIQNKSVKGSVKINFKIDPQASQVSFNSGNLQIDHVAGKNVVGFKLNHSSVIIDFSGQKLGEHEITIHYHGNPTSGLLFNPELDEAYTVFSTSQWMVCNDSPADKAKFTLNLLIPNDQQCIAEGTWIQKTSQDGKTLHSWRQDYESPTYTYGFAIGRFTATEETHYGTMFKYFSKDHSREELATIFRESRKMMSFFEDKSGIKYYQPVYSQILMGDHYQEMSGFSVLKASYGNLVLKDSTETNMISHEMAHQWWGNQITCKNWSHFWLNEAFATYMSAAYNEDRFGKEKYNANITSYLEVYQDIKKRDKDRSLIFSTWSNPSRDDRNLVYFKGAYVLHLLRQELGDQAFWMAIRSYSQKYFGKSVITDDFQQTVEASSGKDLDGFFNEWVYKKEK